MLSPVVSRGIVRAGCCFAVLLLVVGCDRGRGVSPAAQQPSQAVAVDDEQLRSLVDQALDANRARHLDPRVQNAWQIVHGILGFGPGLQLRVEGESVSALEYLMNGGRTEGWVFQPGEVGLEAILQSGTKKGQGHEDQWVGYMSQIGLRTSDEIKVDGKTYTVADLVRQGQYNMREPYEATWTLMALGTYMPFDATWNSRDGSEWNLERLVRMELTAAENLQQSACGGTHRMYAIATVVNQYRREGLPLEGVWKEAYDRVQECVANARRYQQPDGGFSVSYFQRSSTSPDIGKRINTTGHVLEFLTVALTDEELQQPWVTRAATYLSQMLIRTKDVDLECGGLYHAVHGLVLYRQRRFGMLEYTGGYLPPMPPESAANDTAPVPASPPLERAAMKDERGDD